MAAPKQWHECRGCTVAIVTEQHLEMSHKFFEPRDHQAYPDPIIEKAWDMWYEECVETAAGSPWSFVSVKTPIPRCGMSLSRTLMVS